VAGTQTKAQNLPLRFAGEPICRRDNWQFAVAIVTLSKLNTFASPAIARKGGHLLTTLDPVVTSGKLLNSIST
jgi:hypothetical protein